MEGTASPQSEDDRQQGRTTQPVVGEAGAETTGEAEREPERGIIGGTLRLSSAAYQAELAAARQFLAGEGDGDGDGAGEGSLPLGLEIGFGDGSFLQALAGAHPGVRFLGLEVRRRLIEATRVSLARRGLDNVLVLEGDARIVLSRVLPPGRLLQVYVLFPDPWWKQRQWKRRTLVTPAFADLLHRLLAPGGVVTFKTDVPALAEQIVAVFSPHPGYEHADRDRLAPPPGATTKRERRCRHEGTPFVCHRWARRP